MFVVDSCLVAMNGTDYVEETCAEYIPKQDGQTLKARNGLNLSLLRTTYDDHMIVRKLGLTNDITLHMRLITQIQFQSWKMYDKVGYFYFNILADNVRFYWHLA